MIKHLLLSLSFILTALYSTAFSQTGWFWQNPLPQGNTLNNVSYVDESMVYVSGRGGTLMKSTNGGVNFLVVNTGLQDNLSVDFINETTGFSYGFTGSSNGILRTLDGGLSWQYYSVNGHYIRQLFYVNESNMYLITVTYVVNEPDICTIYKSTDLGQTWNSVFEVQQTARINSIFFINQFTGFAAGRKLAVPLGNISKIYKTTNGGSVWDSIQSNLKYELTHTAFINQTTGFVTGLSAGRRVILKTTNACISWDTSYAYNGVEIERIKFFNNNEGYAYTDAQILTTINSGANWTGVTSYNRAAYLANLNNGLGLTDNFIYHTTNTGMSWQNITQGFSNSSVEDVYFINENTGFVTGYNRMFKTTNGGNSWREDTLNTSGSLYVENVQFVNNLTGYAGTADDKLLKTTNAGESWIIYTMGVGCHAHGLHFPSIDTGYIADRNGFTLKTINGGLNWVNLGSDTGAYGDVYFINNTTGFAGGNSYNYGGFIKRTTNGGMNWLKHYIDSASGFYDLFAPNENFWYAVGRAYGDKGVICSSTDMGLTWSVMIIPRVAYSVHFPTVNTGYVTTETYVIYKTTNAGIDWFPTRSINAAVYGGIYFINENTGWAVNWESMIIKTTTGGGGLIGIEPISAEIPRAFVLKQNYPNPFNPQTKINFDLPKATFAELTIYDILGRQVSVPVNEHLTAGKYSVDFDGSNMPSGVYFYRLRTGDFSESRKMILIK